MSPWLVGAIVVLGYVVISVENIFQARKIRRLTMHLESEEEEHAKTIRMYNEAVAAGHPYREAAPEVEEPTYRIFRSTIDSAKWVATNNDCEMAFNCDSPVDALESLVAMEAGECLSEGCDLLDGHDGDCPDAQAHVAIDGSCWAACSRMRCTEGCDLTGQHLYHRCLAHADDLPEPMMHPGLARRLDPVSRALINGTLSLTGGLPNTGGAR